MTAGCPVCGDAAPGRPVREVAGFTYARCAGCGSIHVDPAVLARMDAGGSLVEYTERYWTEELPSARERAFGVSLARLAEAVLYARIPIERFVDVGSGPGYLLDAIERYLPSRASRFHAVEKFPPPAQHRTRSPRYVVGDVGDLPFTVDGGTCIEVAEHLTPRMFRGLLASLARVSARGALYVFNSGMPEYVLHEDLEYLDPVRRGHVVSYSLEGLRHVCRDTGFTPLAIPGKTWAFVLEYASASPPGEDVRDRIWSALPRNVELLTDPEMGSVLKVLGLDTVRAYQPAGVLAPVRRELRRSAPGVASLLRGVKGTMRRILARDR